jgi:predicted S18 family serine protease
MDYKCLAISIALVVTAIVPFSSAAHVGSASIYAPAVLLGNNTGDLTLISVSISTGNGSVSVTGPKFVNASTVGSAINASRYASLYLGKNSSAYNFNYVIDDPNDNVSGPSAGAAMTVITISALTGTPVRSGFTMTGTILPSGSIGQIGGVYDKSGAAAANDMSFILVPSAQSDASEEMLYQLVQDTFHIPLIQVSNVSQALQYALYNKTPIETTQFYNPYTNYMVSSLPSAPLSCTNCNQSEFNKLSAFTFNLTQSEINSVAANPSFNLTANNLSMVLAQSVNVSKLGYTYTGSDLAFLDYIDAFYFSSSQVTEQSGLSTMASAQSYCSSLAAPQLTRQNYEYVLGGELRQGWGSYTITQAISSYNVTGFDTDQILQYMYLAGESSAWCAASSKMYSIAEGIGGQPVNFSEGLASSAQSSINASAKYGNGMYLTNAKEAYNNSNYALAMLDADYESALSGSQSLFAVPQNQTLATSNGIARNSTYGVWATEFANEAEFYISLSRMTSSVPQSQYYTDEAYSSALLANAMSTDMQLIYSNMSNVTVRTSTHPVGTRYNSTANAAMYKTLVEIDNRLYGIFILLGVLIALVGAVLAFAVAAHFHRSNSSGQKVPQRRKRR